MSRLFYHVMQDNVGNLLFDVSGTMRLAGSGTLATIYGDEALTVILPNPMTNHPSFGSFKCYLPAGDYDFYMAKAGYTFETLTGLQGFGSMAQQEAGAVAITGGSITGLAVLGSAGSANISYLGLGTAPADSGYMLNGAGIVRLTNTQVGLNTPPDSAYALALLGAMRLQYAKALSHGLLVQPTGSDGSGGAALLFKNVAGTDVGSITLTGAATAFNTTSDRRLKEAMTPLQGALATVLALQPYRFRWRVDGTPGVGLVADEVQALVPQAVSGTPDAIDPQGIDYSKLVPWLIQAVKELTQQVETLTARLAVVETAP